MEDLKELKEMLAEALPALRDFKEWNTQRKQQEKDEADEHSSSVQEIEKWLKDVDARRRSDEVYSQELEKCIYRGSGSKPIVGEIV